MSLLWDTLSSDIILVHMTHGQIDQGILSPLVKVAVAEMII